MANVWQDVGGAIEDTIGDTFSADTVTKDRPHDDGQFYGGTTYVGRDGQRYENTRFKDERDRLEREATSYRERADTGYTQSRMGADTSRDRAAGYDKTARGWNEQSLGTLQGDARRSRGGQQSAYDRLMMMGDQGPGPSAAQAQLRAGQDANMQQQLAIARSGRGAGAGAAGLRNAQFQGAAMGQQTNQQAAVLRAQEQANWQQQRGQLYNAAGGLASQQRGQDIGTAGLQSQNAMGYGGLGAQAQQNALGYEQQGLGYTQLGAQSGIAYEGMRQNMNQVQLQALQQQSQDRMRSHYAAQGMNLNADLQTDQSNKGMVGGALTLLGTMSDRTAKTDVEIVDPWAEGQETKQEPSTASGMAGLLGGALSSGGKQQPQVYDSSQWTDLGDMSDIRAKRDITPIEAQAETTVRNAPGYSYEYKDPQRHGTGRHYGPMAQDLEKTPAGKSVVHEGPDGKKMVDTSRLSLVNTAAINAQQKKLDEAMARLDALLAMAGNTRRTAEF